jgi:O-antigen/teichoic acid export membrane protein
MTRLAARRQLRISGTRAGFLWAFLGQAFSSATNFALAVIAGRLIGPQGLGTVVIGFTTYQLIAGLQRAVVTQPLIAQSSALLPGKRAELASSGVGVVAATGLAASAVLVVGGFGVRGRFGTGLLVFAPWLLFALLQEFWKAILFQENRGAVGAVSDMTRFVAMAASLPIALAWRDPYAVVTCWGLGMVAGLAIEVIRFRISYTGLRSSFRAWREIAWGLGRWLGAREVVYQVGSAATVLTLAAVIGTINLGGLRSAESLFSPFSLIAAALILPALPALSRALAASRESATHLAFRITMTAVAAGIGYFIVMIFAGPWLLTHLFGSAFSGFRNLVWPMAVAQIFYAAGFAYNALLSAESRGAASFVVGAVLAVTILLLATVLASVYGVTGAAWGMASGAAIGSVLAIALGIRREPLAPGSDQASGVIVP